MKFLDQTGVSELITLVKKALKPLESMKSSITDVNGIVKSDGSGGFSAATAGTDYAAASHTHNYLPLSGGTLTGDLTVGSASVKKNGYIEGTWLKTSAATDKTGNFATIDGDGWVYYRTPAETLGDIGAAAASHTHDYLPLTGGTITGAINYPNAESVYDTEGTVVGTNFLLLDNNGQIVRTSVSDTSLIDELGASPVGHKHAASDIISGTLSVARGGTGAATASGALTNLGAQAKAKMLTLSLTVAGWSATSKTQTRAATGVTASNIVIISPAPASQEAYSTAGVRCTAQGASSLTFTCESIPTEALSVNVVIL